MNKKIKNHVRTHHTVTQTQLASLSNQLCSEATKFALWTAASL